MIPKKLHIIWIGDDKKRPDRWISTWCEKHPDWEIKIWGNDDLKSICWKTQKQIDVFLKYKKYEGVADCMRYEILEQHGGVYVDADSICKKPMDDLLECDFFTVYSGSNDDPLRVANGFIGSVPNHPVMAEMIKAIVTLENPYKKWSWRHMRMLKTQPWKTVGPILFTKVLASYKVNILPSFTFLPHHFGDALVSVEEMAILSKDSYAEHFWGTTFNKY